jgi:hypothetical protein
MCSLAPAKPILLYYTSMRRDEEGWKVMLMPYTAQHSQVWMRKEQYAEMDRVRGRMAEYLGADSDDVVFVENASHGVKFLHSRHHHHHHHHYRHKLSIIEIIPTHHLLPAK